MTQCLYFGLQGLLLNKVPTEDFLKTLTPQKIYQTMQHYFPDNEQGIVSTFWGTDQLNYSSIIKLEDLSEYQPDFQIQNGLIIPKIPLCGTDDDQTHIAMREILYQALTHATDERKNKYFMITPFPGCSLSEAVRWK